MENIHNKFIQEKNKGVTCRFFAFTHGVSRRLLQKPDEASRWHHPLAKLLQIKENRKLKFILPMLYYIDGF